MSSDVTSAYDARPWVAAYPAGVPADVDVPDVTLGRLLDDAASSHPTTIASAFLGAEVTYRQLAADVDRLAGGLAGLGVGTGDRVALVLPNCPQFVVAFFAAMRLGAVVVPLGPLATEEELARQFGDCTPTVVICLDKTVGNVAAAAHRVASPHLVVASALDAVPPVTRQLLRVPLARNRRKRAALSEPIPGSIDALRYPALLRSTPPAFAPVDPSTVAVLLYTGGTTGVARAAMLTHRNLVANAHQVRLWYGDAQPGREVTLGALPMSHAYGLTLGLLVTTLLAGTLVLLPRWNLDGALEAIDKYRPTLFPGVPPIYAALVASPKTRGHDLRSIRACVSGAMRLPPEIQEQFERVTGGRVVEGYGMTETSPVTHANPLDGSSRAGAIGVPLPGTRCRLVSVEDPEQVVEPGAPGEIAVAGPQVFAGYWGADDLPGLFTADGYYLTGDVAVMDADGFFTVVDRKKEVIIAGGLNVYPLEVEEALLAHPRVDDVCVVGVPDRYRGETVKAFVVPAEGVEVSPAELTDHCARLLTAYKIPKQFEFRSELPRTALGKVQRHLLRAEADRGGSGGQS